MIFFDPVNGQNNPLRLPKFCLIFRFLRPFISCFPAQNTAKRDQKLLLNNSTITVKEAKKTIVLATKLISPRVQTLTKVSIIESASYNDFRNAAEVSSNQNSSQKPKRKTFTITFFRTSFKTSDRFKPTPP